MQTFEPCILDTITRDEAMSVTIKDVAKASGVSPSTVSRVIADNPRISPETKKKVRRIMKELGYHPNFNARSLVANSTNTIGIVMPRSTKDVFLHPFFPEVIRGISVAAHEKEHMILMSTGSTQEEQLAAISKMIHGKRVDGVILLSSNVNDPLISMLLEWNFPFVLIGSPDQYKEKVNYVDNNNIEAAKEATIHLLRYGHQKIAFIGGSKELVVTRNRLEGYKQALSQFNIPYNEEMTVFVEFRKEAGYSAIDQLFSAKHPPTSILVTDDLIAVGVLTALKEKGYHIPDDVSVVSFNNLTMAELSNPSLTSVDISIFTLGYQAASRLFTLIKDPEAQPQSIEVPTKLVIRKSSI